MAPSLIALRAFEAIGRLGGIRRAAAALGVSHAIVSRHLRGLEEQLGVPLFDRESGRLTAHGAAYHARIAAAFAEIGAATAALTADRGDRLVIGCAPGLASLWLTARLARFATGLQAPIVELQALDRPPDLAEAAVAGDIRYGLDGVDAGEGRDIRQVELARPPVFPVAAPGFAATIWPLIEEGDGTEWRRWLAAKRAAAPAARIVARYGHAHLALAAARAGQGVALANPYLLGDDLAAGRLVRLAPYNPAFAPVKLGAYFFRAHRSRWSERPLALFRRWLVDEFHAPTELGA